MSEKQSRISNFLNFCSNHKVFVLLFIMFVPGLIMLPILKIGTSARNSELNSRDYELSIDVPADGFACNATSTGECQARVISGTLKKYPNISVKLDDYSDCSLNGNNFDCDYTAKLADYYETENLSPESLPAEFEKVVTISIDDGRYIDERVSKKVTIKFTLSESDKTIISNLQQEYLAKKTREAEEAARKEHEEAQPQQEVATNEPEPQPEPQPETAAPEQSQTAPSSGGYQAIYDEYAARLINECPTLSLAECAELNNEGVTKMAEYMWSASGVDGQYATYEQWSGKLMDVYMQSAR